MALSGYGLSITATVSIIHFINRMKSTNEYLLVFCIQDSVSTSWGGHSTAAFPHKEHTIQNLSTRSDIMASSANYMGMSNRQASLRYLALIAFSLDSLLRKKGASVSRL